MKLFKTMFLFVLLCTIAFSCKETKKEETESNIETTEIESTSSDDVATESTNNEEVSEATASDANASEDKKEVEKKEAPKEEEASVAAPVPVKASPKEVEVIKTSNVIVEATADTPVIYPGCSGTAQEIRACSIKEFINFFQKNIDDEVINSLGLGAGTHDIRGLLKISKLGKVSVIQVEAEKQELEKEFKRVIGLYPTMTAATKGSKPVDVAFVLPIKYKVAN